MALLDKVEGLVGMQLPQNGPARELAQRTHDISRANDGSYKPSLEDQLKNQVKARIPKKKPRSRETSPAAAAAGQQQHQFQSYRVDPVEGEEAAPAEEGQQLEAEYEEPELSGGGRFKQKVGGRLNAQDDYESELLAAQGGRTAR